MKHSLIFTLILILTGACLSQTRHDLVQKGNALYKKGDYGGAVAKYKSAETKGALPAIEYNLGSAHFKADNLDLAQQALLKALNGSDNDLKAKAMYNLGNAFLKKGDAEKAIASYINSLKLNPKDIETKRNLEYALRQQKQQQNQQDQQKQDKQDQQDQQKQQQEQQKQQQQQEQQQQQMSQQKDKMSKEDAEKILNAVMNDEKKTQEKVNKQLMAGRKARKKNW